MILSYYDENLTEHEIDISDAVEIKLNGLFIHVGPEDYEMRIRSTQSISVRPFSANEIRIKGE